MMPGLTWVEGLIAQADALQEARRERLDDHVGGGGQAPEEGLAVGGGDVQGDAALAGVVSEEVEALLGVHLVVVEGADAAAGVAAGRLDLDDVGS